MGYLNLRGGNFSHLDLLLEIRTPKGNVRVGAIGDSNDWKQVIFVAIIVQKFSLNSMFYNMTALLHRRLSSLDSSG